MSTATLLRVPLTVPKPLSNTPNYTVQFSLHNSSRDSDIFLEKIYRPTDLSSSAQSGTMTATFRRGELPQWSIRENDEGEDVVELRAHFWKGTRCVETVECGTI
ncbi:hypothetical protein K504DRAFT_461155 [Pleomassaria siparia CBS 279.74]|uniref:Uncharacterized protein n=1 Tax=Pleomassaria siparia CBS 279.74 TaxID=1314801 RepID=A0A6G1JUW2_9PLEO|nr:hypothetical protein K504DRAFT_461155 [Pleomassaria siparia CBS 279.74]